MTVAWGRQRHSFPMCLVNFISFSRQKIFPDTSPGLKHEKDNGRQCDYWPQVHAFQDLKTFVFRIFLTCSGLAGEIPNVRARSHFILEGVF